MIRPLIFAVLLPLLRAQSPPVIATTATQPDGKVILTIRNHGASPLTAYFFKRFGWGVLPDGGKGVRVTEIGYKDAALESATRPIPPNGQINSTFLNGEVQFLAALWADGTSYGDPQWVSRLRDRRGLAQQHLDNAIAILQHALDSGTDTPTLVKQLQTSIDEITSTTVNPEDVPLLRIYYQEAIRRFANPDGVARSGVDGSPLHMTDRQIIELTLELLQMRRDRLQQ